MEAQEKKQITQEEFEKLVAELNHQKNMTAMYSDWYEKERTKSETLKLQLQSITNLITLFNQQNEKI